MTMFDDVAIRAVQVYPKVQIKYKNESLFMKILGTILFFNPGFMNSYITTIGNTVYFPKREFVQNNPVSATITLLHELVHVRDSQSRNMLFGLLYLMPQLLVLLGLPLLFIFGWKVALFSLIFLLPLPAYFRMQDERKAYTISLYVVNKINQQHEYNIDIDQEGQFFAKQFSGPAYFFMWPFGMKSYFADAVAQIKTGGRPNYEVELYNITDKILGY